MYEVFVIVLIIFVFRQVILGRYFFKSLFDKGVMFLVEIFIDNGLIG